MAGTNHFALNQSTERIIGCAYKVSNALGCGFLEKVYENALAYELTSCGFLVQQQCAIKVHYKDRVVGDYVADLLVDSSILIELKAVRTLDEGHLAQCMNYLKATRLKICLLMNFGKPKIDVRRIVLNL